MKRWTTCLFVGLLAASMFAFVACDDEPTQEEANQKFCDDVAELIVSLRAIRDLDGDSTLDEIQGARERAQDAYEDTIASSEGVVDARLDDLETAYLDLQQAVDDLDADATLSEALDDVNDEIEQVATEASKILNDVDCGGSGSDSQSDE